MEILKNFELSDKKGAVLPDYSISLLITVLSFLAIATLLTIAINYRTQSSIDSVKETVPCPLNSEGKRELDGSAEACL